MFHINILVASIDDNPNKLLFFKVSSNSIVNDACFLVQEHSEIRFSNIIYTSPYVRNVLLFVLPTVTLWSSLTRSGPVM